MRVIIQRLRINLRLWYKGEKREAAEQVVKQVEMMKIFALFRQAGYQGEHEGFRRVRGTARDFFVVTSNEQGIKALSKASLMLETIEFHSIC